MPPLITDNTVVSTANNRVKNTTHPIDTHGSHRPLALTSPKQRQGSYFEQQACIFLQQQGLTLIAQNWQQPKAGELDLVMLETGQAWSTVVFVEVRQRKSSIFGDAALSVTTAKQRKIITAATYFLQQHPTYRDYECRFVVIAYNSQQPPNGKTDQQPERLVGAFITTAW